MNKNEFTELIDAFSESFHFDEAFKVVNEEKTTGNRLHKYGFGVEYSVSLQDPLELARGLGEQFGDWMRREFEEKKSQGRSVVYFGETYMEDGPIEYIKGIPVYFRLNKREVNYPMAFWDTDKRKIVEDPCRISVDTKQFCCWVWWGIFG